MNQHYALRKRSLQHQRVDRAHKHGLFAEAYHRQRRTELVWGSILILLMGLLAIVPPAIFFFARYGK